MFTEEELELLDKHPGHDDEEQERAGSLYPSTYLFIYSSIYLSIYLFIYLAFSLSLSLSGSIFETTRVHSYIDAHIHRYSGTKVHSYVCT